MEWTRYNDGCVMLGILRQKGFVGRTKFERIPEQEIRMTVVPSYGRSQWYWAATIGNYDTNGLKMGTWNPLNGKIDLVAALPTKADAQAASIQAGKELLAKLNAPRERLNFISGIKIISTPPQWELV